MGRRTVFKSLLLSALMTIGIAVVALLFQLFQSVTFSRVSGIELAAGGLSGRFVTLMALGLPAIFALTYILLRGKLSPPQLDRHQRK